MTCQELTELLYDRLVERLTEEESQAVDTHVRQCPRCQREFEKVQRTVSWLDEWTIPDPSPDFEKRLVAYVTTNMAKAHRARGRGRLSALFRSFRRPMPAWGLAVAATVLLIVVIYQGFTPDDQKVEEMTKELQVAPAVTEANRPIVIETKDLDKTLLDLFVIVQSRGGQLVRRRPVEAGMEVTLKIAEREEQGLLRELRKLGRVSVPKEGYQDGEGNMVVVLKKEGTFAP